MRCSRILFTIVLAGATVLIPAQAGLAEKPRIFGPIVSYKCPPAPLWCTKALRPGVTLQHLRAKMRSGPTQSIYKLSWPLGDHHVQLLAEPLNAPTSNGAIPLGTISHWAARSAPPGFLGAINADFFGIGSSWSLGVPSGMLVHARQVIDFGTGGPGVGYEPNGQMVMGTPIAKPVKLTLRQGRTATIGAFDPGSSLSGIKRDQVVVKTTGTVGVATGWTGYVVGSASTPSPFTSMLHGSETMKNTTGNGRSENVAGFRFGDDSGLVPTVTLPIVPAPTGAVHLGPGQALVMAQTGQFADTDLAILTAHSQQLKVSVDAQTWSNVEEVMGGKPQLVRNGKVTYAAAGVNPPMMSSDGWQWMFPHWRPAVAESKTRGWLIITGGVNYADGVYGWTWGKMLAQLGAVNAMGFDNNSSTEMYMPGIGTWSYAPHWEREITEATALTFK